MKGLAPRPPGRPKEKNPANQAIYVRLTPEQKSKYMELGGARWIKRLLDEYIASRHK